MTGLADQLATISALYAEMELSLRRLAALHEDLAVHYRAGSVAHSEHQHSARAARRVIDYWQACVGDHRQDLTGCAP